MKLSTINWLSKAIALPLFMTIISIANSVGAEQIDRSRAKLVDSLPSVTDLNLMVPVGVDILPPEDREQYSSLEPFWSKSSQNNSSRTVIKERNGKTRLTTRRKNKSLMTINTSLGADRQVIKTKAIHRNKVLTSNGYDGTAGCIGVTTATDRDAINEFVTKYQPRNLVVKIGSLEDSQYSIRSIEILHH